MITQHHVIILYSTMENNEKKVLIIEKDSGVANMIRAILAIVRVPVIHVQNTADAFDVLQEERIGMIWCESNDPNPAAYNLMKEVRNNPDTKQIPFLMLVPEEKDIPPRSVVPEEKADKYIVKPFTARGVLDVVKEFIVYKNL